MTNDREFNPPDVCKICGEGYKYRKGMCRECYQAAEEDYADQKREERLIAKHFGEGSC